MRALARVTQGECLDLLSSVETIDQMDAAINLLRIVYLALQGAEDPAADMIEAIATYSLSDFPMRPGMV
jgi:hypothetical protein